MPRAWWGGRPRGGWPATAVRGVWCQALSLPRPPVFWSGQPGFRDPCVPGAVGAGMGTEHRPHSVRPCGLGLLAVGMEEGRPRTYDFSSCFFPKFKKSAKGRFSREMTYFFGFYGPKIGGGGFLLPGACPKISKTLKFGLFWGIFACSGLVLQNSAAHQCTCL